MPDRDVKTIRDLIYYQYSKLIARSSFGIPDGVSVKKEHYGFIKSTFRALQSGRKSWSEITREDKQLVNEEKKCIYCGAGDTHLQWEHIVPKSIAINERCRTCPKIQEIHNMVWACPECNRQKRTLGLYEFYRQKFPDDNKYYDRIPSLIEKKYLKTIYNCHYCAKTLDFGDIDGDGEVSVRDIDAIINTSPQFPAGRGAKDRDNLHSLSFLGEGDGG
jgi:5-methylcytosine-specific restriction endonuclease McrA